MFIQGNLFNIWNAVINEGPVSKKNMNKLQWNFYNWSK